MKYRVHTWQATRITYEIEAGSPEEAQHLISRDGWEMNPVSHCVDDPEWSPQYTVDPILTDGEVDYDNVVNFDESSPDFKEYQG